MFIVSSHIMFALLFMLVVENVISQLPSPTAISIFCTCCPAAQPVPLEPEAKVNFPSVSYLGHGVLSQQQRTNYCNLKMCPCFEKSVQEALIF